jgi:hypothetical protein
MPISPQAAGTENGSPSAAQGSGNMMWKPSPRWAAVKGNDKIDGEQDN